MDGSAISNRCSMSGWGVPAPRAHSASAVAQMTGRYPPPRHLGGKPARGGSANPARSVYAEIRESAVGGWAWLMTPETPPSGQTAATRVRTLLSREIPPALNDLADEVERSRRITELDDDWESQGAH